MNRKTKRLSPSSRSLPVPFQDRVSQLKRENIFLDQIIESLPMMIFIKDARELRFVRFNKAGEKLLGYPKRQMMGKNDYDFFTKREADFFTREDRKVLASKKLRLIPEEPIHTKKQLRVLRTKKVPLLDQKGKPAFLLGISEDITQEKADAKALKESEERFRSVVHFAPYFIMLIDREGVIQFINRTQKGYRIKDVVGTAIFDYIPKESRQRVIKTIRSVFSKGKAVSYEVESIDAKGRKRIYSTQVAPIKEGSRVVRATLFSTDVTDAREAEANLKIFQGLMNQTSDSVFVVNPKDSLFIYVNSTAAEFLGWSEKELLKLKVTDIDELIPDQKTWQVTSKTIREKKNLLLNTRLKKKDGGSVPVEISVRHLDLGQKSYFIAIVRDISERQKLEKLVLDVGDLEKQRIGQDLHDDLGQDLSAIALMGRALERKIRHKGKTETHEFEKMLDLVKKCIDKTRLLSRGLAPVNLRADGLASGLQDLAFRTEEIFKIECRFQKEPGFYLEDSALAAQLFRIAQEAVHNAVKHAHTKKITIDLKKRNHQIELTILDWGRGFPKKVKGKKKGMGLAILKYRAQALGGTFEISNRSTKGVMARCLVPLPQKN